MLTDEQLTDFIRDELACELANISSSPQLLANVRRRHAQRSMRTVTIAGVAAIAAGVAIVVPVADSGRPAAPSKTAQGNSRYVTLSGPVISLAGYETNLPAGYTFTEAATGTSCSNFFVPVGIAPSPGTPPPSQSFSPLALQASGVSGCLSFGISGNDETESDSIAPPGSQSLTIGSYQASVYQVANSPTLAIYVQIPTIGGGHHDLIVAAQGITQPDLVAMVEKALPTQVTPAPASDVPLVEPSPTAS